MRMKVLFFLLSAAVLSADSVPDPKTRIGTQTIYDVEQRKIFESQTENRTEDKKSYKMEEIVVEEDAAEENCVMIEQIIVRDTTLFGQGDFDDLIRPYPNNCNGMKNLNNLLNKISNRYISRGYVTSRAYLRGQDLSDGIVEISVLEGKIERIEDQKGEGLDAFSGYRDRILNLRDLEVRIQQMERLRSQRANIELYPGTKAGYSIVKIVRQSAQSPFYGDIELNNYGNDKSGKMQINGSFSYENPGGIDDILTLGVYVTNNVFKENNNLWGKLSYSFPLGKSLLDFEYSKMAYKQINTDEFAQPYYSDGSSENVAFNATYKLFHTNRSRVELLGGIEYKNSENYLNDIKLELQSYALSVGNIGMKYGYEGEELSVSSTFSVYKGFDAFGAKDDFAAQESDFLSYVLELNFTKRFPIPGEPVYNLFFRGQYSDDNLYGTEEISMGGMYSVRGFGETALSGNAGFYGRNEISSAFYANDFRMMPYIALDVGHVKKDERNVYGDIVGSAVGIRQNWKGFYVDMAYTYPLKDASLVKEQSGGFFGISARYRF